MDSLPVVLTVIYGAAMTFAAVVAVVAAKLKAQEPTPIRVEKGLAALK